MKTRSILMMVLMCLAFNGENLAAETLTLKYAHMNPPTSVAGLQATMFAELVAAKTGGAVKIEVYPASQLGTTAEMVEQVEAGVVAFHHNTMAGIGSLYEPLSALDTPYLYRDVAHLSKATSVDSTVIQKLNEELVKARGLRILYTFYFGTRHLTANKAIRTPADLSGVKIRAIPFPIYMAAVEGMGATATPVDWAEVPNALKSGLVSGQENPFDTIYTAKLYEIQSYLMLTGHIMGAECIVVNDKVWQGLTPAIQAQITEAAREVSQKATQMTLDGEASTLTKLKEAGMTVIGPEEGLELNAFRTQTDKLVTERFGTKFGALYQEIRAIQ
jgi:TRAP-type transport system periplasmic protein